LLAARRLYFSLAFPNAQSLPQGPLPEDNVRGPLPRGDSLGENVRSAMKLAVGYARYVCLASVCLRLLLVCICLLFLLAFTLRSLAFSSRLLDFSLRLLAFS
jgi:hypothetical protein